jgi:hypothetical protein
MKNKENINIAKLFLTNASNVKLDIILVKMENAPNQKIVQSQKMEIVLFALMDIT